MGLSVPDAGRRPIGPHRASGVTGLLLRCGAAAGPIFITTFLVEGALRPDYDPLRHPVSSLALGRRGCVQRLNFLLAGGLYTAGAIGLGKAQGASDAEVGRSARSVPPLVAAAAAGLIGAGAFVTDPISGYPPGTPEVPAGRSTFGVLHDLLSVPTFIGVPAAALLAAVSSAHRGHSRWAAYSAASGLGMLSATVAATVAFSQAPRLVAHGGLLQRAAVTSGFTWLTAAHIRALRSR